jgi:large conductance mechanosensitive channel
MLKEFREFVLRGNAIDLAVAVVIGAAFGAVVNSLVADLFTPLVAMVFGEPDFGALKLTINGTEFRYGGFLNTVVSLITIGAAVFFLVVRPLNLLMARRRAGEVPEPQAVPQDVVLLTEIRDLLADRYSGRSPSRPT